MSDQKDKGQILKKARESKGISLETVHESTKIPKDVLRAIEEGYTVRNLSSFYIRGFLKLYAQYLDLDIKQVIEDYRRETLPEHIPLSISRERQSMLLQEKLSKVLSKRNKQQFVLVVGYLLAAFVLFKVMGFLIHKVFAKEGKMPVIQSVKEQDKKNKPAKTLKELQQGKTSKATPTSKSKEPVSNNAQRVETKTALGETGLSNTPQNTSRPQEVKKNITLSVRAKKNTWLQVKVDGEVVFQAILKKGVAETWFADKDIELSGRNINQLEFELNGRMLGTLGREERMAKKVMITKDGLSVKK